MEMVENRTANFHYAEAVSDTNTCDGFTSAKETTVLVDASPVGLRAILTQNRKVICYTSCALTDTEQFYSQTDREFLTVVYGVEYFH